MKRTFSLLILVAFTVFPLVVLSQKGSFGEVKQLQSPQTPRLGFIIHGGAGVITRGSLTPEKEKAYRDKLAEVVMAGY